jgi:lysozyme
MHISNAGLALIEQFEGFSPWPYWDPYGRVWTRGYGETEGITRWSPPITRQQGERHLRELIEQRYEWAIRDLHVQLNQNQWDALCSFVWNLGAGIFTGELRNALLRGDWRAATNQMIQYDHAGGQVLPGLLRRRQLEVTLFLRPIPAYMPADETRWEREWDQLRGRRAPWAHARRIALKRTMTRRRKRIWHLAEHTGWDQLNRKARWYQLLTRTEH